MEYSKILERIKDLDKSDILITDAHMLNYNKIGLNYRGVRLLDLTRPQFEKLKADGYEFEVIVV